MCRTIFQWFALCLDEVVPFLCGDWTAQIFQRFSTMCNGPFLYVGNDKEIRKVESYITKTADKHYFLITKQKYFQWQV